MLEDARSYVFSLIDYTNVDKVLDIGCGRGSNLIDIGKRLGDSACMIGIDKMERAIDQANEITAGDGRFSFRQEDAENSLNFADDTFDLVICNDALECINDKNDLLNETYRVLKPGGRSCFRIMTGIRRYLI